MWRTIAKKCHHEQSKKFIAMAITKVGSFILASACFNKSVIAGAFFLNYHHMQHSQMWRWTSLSRDKFLE
jgi:hypothetical protein